MNSLQIYKTLIEGFNKINERQKVEIELRRKRHKLFDNHRRLILFDCWNSLIAIKLFRKTGIPNMADCCSFPGCDQGRVEVKQEREKETGK